MILGSSEVINDWKDKNFQMEASDFVFLWQKMVLMFVFCVQLGVWEKCDSICYRLWFDGK